MNKVEPNSHFDIDANGCWIWRGGVDSYGYGVMSYNVKAHRFFYETHVGEIPDGLCVCHKCDVRNCVNPSHLFLGTSQENTADKTAKGRQVKGKDVHKAKLTDADVREILALDLPCRVLAEQYGVTDTTISYIKMGKTWKHVPRPDNYEYTPYRAPGDHTKFEDLQA